MKKKFSISMISMMVLVGSLFSISLAKAQDEDIEDEATEDEEVEEGEMMRDITYIVTLIDDVPVIFVTEQMEDASEIHYTETDNTDLQAIFNDWVEQNQ